jgi:hypothetical protein
LGARARRLSWAIQESRIDGGEDVWYGEKRFLFFVLEKKIASFCCYMISAAPCQSVSAVSHAEDIEISLCDGNSEDERRRRKIGSLRRKAIHALKKRGRRRVDFRFPPAAISIEDVRDAEEERAVASFRDRLAAHGLLPEKHDDYHMMLRSHFKSRPFISLPAFGRGLLNASIQYLKLVSPCERLVQVPEGQEV